MTDYSDPYFKLPLLEKLKICREKAKELFGDDSELTQSIEGALIKTGLQPKDPVEGK